MIGMPPKKTSRVPPRSGRGGVKYSRTHPNQGYFDAAIEEEAETKAGN
jgi:hypothetical protein